MTTHGVAPFPLYWPLQHPRSKTRQASHFLVDFVTARTHLTEALLRLGARNVVISSNVPIRRDGLPGVPDREPEDPGVAVYFSRERKSYVIACDRFQRVRFNLRAIGLTIEALRAIERHATTTMLEQAFSGFAQLPAAGAAKPWRQVLGVPDGPTSIGLVRDRFFELARIHHPDQGGDTARMAEINAAFEQAALELGP